MLVGRDADALAALDAAALKPTERGLDDVRALPLDRVVVDYEGRANVPSPDGLAGLAREFEVRVTTPVRADGFDPLGDDSVARRLPDGVGRVLVAGHSAYLDDDEARRAVAPRLAAALRDRPDAWVGTEGIERVALATGATQFDLLSGSTRREVAALRDAGFQGDVAVYAPVAVAGDADTVLDAVGAYAARRPDVAAALPPDAPVGSDASGRARDALIDACREYALVGDLDDVRDRIAGLRDAGVDHVVGYPARGAAGE